MKKLFLVLFLLLMPSICMATGSLDISHKTLFGTNNSNRINVRFNDTMEKVTLSAEYNYAEVINIVVSDNGIFRINYDTDVTDTLSLWFYNQVRYNKIRGINIENFLGFGPKYYFIKKYNFEVSLSIGYLKHYYELEDGTNGHEDRASIRPKFKYNKGMFEFYSIIFYQPNMQNARDYIYTSSSYVKYNISEDVGIKYQIDDEYRSTNTEGERRETVIAGYVSFNF